MDSWLLSSSGMCYGQVCVIRALFYSQSDKRSRVDKVWHLHLETGPVNTQYEFHRAVTASEASHH